MQKKSKVLIAIVVVVVLVLATIVFTSCIPVSKLTPTPTQTQKEPVQTSGNVTEYEVQLPEDIARDGTGTPKVLSAQTDGNEIILTYAYINEHGKGVKTVKYYYQLGVGWSVFQIFNWK